MHNFSEVFTTLTELLISKKVFKGLPEAQIAFKKLKDVLINAPVLQTSDMNKQLSIQVYAGDEGAGAVLLQNGANAMLHQVCYFSAKYFLSETLYYHRKGGLVLLWPSKKFSSVAPDTELRLILTIIL